MLPELDTAPFKFGVFLPLGARRGRVYFTCRNTFVCSGATQPSRGSPACSSTTHARSGPSMFEPDYRHRGLAIAAMAAGLAVLGRSRAVGAVEPVEHRIQSARAPEAAIADPNTEPSARSGHSGDPPNPGALFHGNFPSDDQTQERRVGGPPARFSGYTTWVRSVTRVPARKYVDGYPGAYLRVHVTVVNRDTQSQHVCACDFFVWTRTAGYREADVVAAPTLASDTDMSSGARRDGDVYLYVGTVPGPYYVVYDPDDARRGRRRAPRAASGRCRVPRTISRVASPSTRSGPPPTPG